ncbi:MAG: urease accessory protein UreD [Geminicoccaceae bacterium]|nr:urease accessory protein UreD [Geminicoccaceae bacterium]
MKPMSASISPSRLQRSQGRAELAFKRRGPATVLDRLQQQGCARIRLPDVHNPGCPEAVLLNTAGGLTGGDRFEFSCHWGEGTAATVATQAAERIYRSSGGTAHVANRLTIAEAASAHWLPQETILFDGGAIERQFEADLAADARLVAVESWMIGRHAMGETVRSARIREHWRIRREGKLVFADTFRLDGNLQALLERPAVAQGRTCFATVLVACRGAAKLSDVVRPHASCSVLGDMLVGRLLAMDIADLRRRLQEFMMLLELRVPRVWAC